MTRTGNGRIAVHYHDLAFCRRRWCHGAFVAADIAGRIRVIVIDMRRRILDAAGFVRAVCVGACMPVARFVVAPSAVAVLMRGRRDGTLVTADVAGRIRIIVVDMRCRVLDAARSVRAIRVGALVPVVCLVVAPSAVAVLMRGRRDGTLVTADVAGRIRIIVVDMHRRILDAARPVRAIRVGACMPVVCFVVAPSAVAVLMCGRRDGTFVAADIAVRVRIIVIAVCLRLPALIRIGAIFICADAVVTGFAIGSPSTVDVLMLRAKAPVGTDIAEFILIVIIDVGRAIQFFAPIRAVFG